MADATSTSTANEETALHNKYRPKTLEDVIGHEAVVQKLQGVVESGKWPSAIAFFGPTSAGKTTIGRALAASLYGRPAKGHPDYLETCMTDARSIEDVRQLIQVSKMRPSQGQRRFLLLDEAQGVLGNAPAAGALLAALESPPKSTTWILCSMSPETFMANKNGKAIANRCIQYHLQAPTEALLMKQSFRIAKGEGVNYLSKEFRKLLAERCNKEMRTQANMIQDCIMYYEGLPKKDRPETLTEEQLNEVLSGSMSEDDTTAVRFLTAVYARKYSAAHKEILNITDGFGFIQKLLYLNWFVLSDAVLKGARHPAVWGNQNGFTLRSQMTEVTSSLTDVDRVQLLGQVQAGLAVLKSKAQAFAMPEAMAIQQFAWDTIQQLKATASNK